MPIKLVCFDLDDTIINGHLHRSLEQAGIKPGQADQKIVCEHIEKIGGIKNRMALQRTIKDLLKNGINVAITSYTGYPESIPGVLKAVGLNDSEIARIQCASFTPPKGPHGERTEGYGKNHHIERAIAAFGGAIKPEEVVLVDDRVDHFKLAQERGYNVVWVQGGEDRVDYLNEVRELAGLSQFATLQAPAHVTQPAQEPQGWVDKMLGLIGLARMSATSR